MRDIPQRERGFWGGGGGENFEGEGESPSNPKKESRWGLCRGRGGGWGGGGGGRVLRESERAHQTLKTRRDEDLVIHAKIVEYNN